MNVSDISPDDEMLNTEEAAEFCRLEQQTLASWRCHGKGPPFVRIGRAIRYPKSAIIQFLQSNLVQPNMTSKNG